MKVYSPRIHNLGDFMHCLPTLSGLYQKYGQLSFGICDRLKRFNGIKDLLLYQGIFSDVHFMDEQPIVKEYIIIDDSGSDDGNLGESLVSRRFYNFVRSGYVNFDFDLDTDFELQVPWYNDIQNNQDKILIGDRWSPKDAPDVDDRRLSNLIKEHDKFNTDKFHYLDYSDHLLYNISLIKYNPNPFLTTFTGIGIIADLMKKETKVLWDDDMRMWNGKPVEDDFRLHYFTNRNSSLHYIKDFDI